eukprot:11182883-Lingulodinium_polyedra.AAC.1
MPNTSNTTRTSIIPQCPTVQKKTGVPDAPHAPNAPHAPDAPNAAPNSPDARNMPRARENTARENKTP